MKRPNLLIKVATITSSVLLVAGFVSYRAGAFNWLTGNEAAPAAPGFLGGSKSKVLIEPTSQTPAQGQTPASPSPAFMSSSKSIILVDPPPEPTPATPVSATCPSAPTPQVP